MFKKSLLALGAVAFVFALVFGVGAGHASAHSCGMPNPAHCNGGI